MVPECFGALARVADCEERLVNCWPGHETVVVGPWLCRFAQGYSGRANSAGAVMAGQELAPEAQAHIEALYRAAGLRPSFRLSPLVLPEVQARLESEGYQAEDGSVGMIGPAFGGLPDADLLLEPVPSAAWLDGACRWQEPRKRDVEALRRIVSAIRLPVRFATLMDQGRPAGYAVVALDRGMAEFGAVMVDPALRGRGLGRKLVLGLTHWAHEAGAREMFFQVATGNRVAMRLYESLGFSSLYTAAYWRQPGG